MSETKAYGASDDLVEIEGEVNEEFGAYDRDRRNPKRVAFSDGTVLLFYYPKRSDLGVWGIDLAVKGSLFDRLDECEDEDARPHSDVAYFKAGLTAVCEHASLRTDRVTCPHCREEIALKLCPCCGAMTGSERS